MSFATVICAFHLWPTPCDNHLPFLSSLKCLEPPEMPIAPTSCNSLHHSIPEYALDEADDNHRIELEPSMVMISTLNSDVIA